MVGRASPGSPIPNVCLSPFPPSFPMTIWLIGITSVAALRHCGGYISRSRTYGDSVQRLHFSRPFLFTF